MTDLTQFNLTTLDKINSGLIKQELRPYLGMSQIGHHCERYLWLSFRWCFDSYFEPRMLRLFARGHREENYSIRPQI